jgi:hypothetical protein|nr:MAG TPA: resistance protein [Caudoviricetes sp.]
MHIYEIDSRLRKLMDGEIEEYVNMETGEVDRERLNEEIKNLHMAAEEREESLACLAAEKRAAADVLKEKAKAILDRAKRAERDAEWLRALVASSMMLRGVKKLETAQIAATVTTTKSVEIEDMRALPGSFIRVKTVEEPDKVAIGNAIKAGQAVPGAYLKENIGLRLK